MGLWKDLAHISRVGKEINKNHDGAASLAQMQASMAHTNTLMQDMAARATSTAAVQGTPTTATVTGARETGQYVNMQPVIAIDLLVQPAVGMPVPVTITDIVSQLHVSWLRPGSSLGVKIGATPKDVVIDWAGRR